MAHIKTRQGDVKITLSFGEAEKLSRVLNYSGLLVRKSKITTDDDQVALDLYASLHDLGLAPASHYE